MNRAIDERILPDSAIVNMGGRRVVALAWALTRYYFQTAPALSADFRRRIVGWMAEQILRKSGMREPAPSARVASRRVVKSSAQRRAG